VDNGLGSGVDDSNLSVKYSFSLFLGVLMCTGDILAQVFIEKKTSETYDFYRSGRFFFYGALVVVCYEMLISIKV
jgi:hypothetical protein